MTAAATWRTAAFVAVAIAVGWLVAVNPVWLLGLVVAAVLLWSIRKPEYLLGVAIASEMLFTGWGRWYELSVAGLTVNGTVVVDLFVLAFAVSILLYRHQPLLYREAWPLTALVVLTLLGLAIAPDLLLGVKGVLKLVSFVVLYALARYAGRQPSGWDKIVNWITFLAIGVFALGLIEYFTGFDPIGNQGIVDTAFSASGSEAIGHFARIRSTFTHPNQFGLAAAMLTMLFAGEAYARRSKGFGVLTLAGVFCVVLTFSRIAWLALAMGTVLLVLRAGTRGRRLATLAPVALTVLLVAILLGPLIMQRAQVDASAVLRQTIFETELELFKGSPLYGIGYAGFRALSPSLFGYPLDAHGDYMRLLAETGIIGLALLLAWFGRPIVVSLRAGKQASEPQVAIRHYVIAACFMCAAVFAITDNAIDGLGLLVLLWGLHDGWAETITDNVGAQPEELTETVGSPSAYTPPTQPLES